LALFKKKKKHEILEQKVPPSVFSYLWKQFRPYLLVFIIVCDISGYLILTSGEKLKTADITKKGTTYSPKDCAVVFFHSYSKAKSTYDLCDETKRRMNFAVMLYKNQLTRRILCVGGNRGEKTLAYGSALMKKYAAEQKIPEDVLYNEIYSYDTVTNLTEAEKIINAHEWKKIVLISSHLHINRMRSIVKRSGTFRNETVELTFLPFSMQTIPRKGILFLFGEYHYNVTAYLIYRVLPYKIYDRIVRWKRLGKKLIRLPSKLEFYLLKLQLR
jgi:uncharacterized SAM-binding protein YcdF (DUF218 family)